MTIRGTTYIWINSYFILFILQTLRWLDTGEDDGRIVREIEVDTPGDPWTLTTVTSSEAGAGTQGPAVVVLYTDKGRSEPVYFGDTVNFQFEEGKTQEFPIFVSVLFIAPPGDFVDSWGYIYLFNYTPFMCVCSRVMRIFDCMRYIKTTKSLL